MRFTESSSGPTNNFQFADVAKQANDIYLPAVLDADEVNCLIRELKGQYHSHFFQEVVPYNNLEIARIDKFEIMSNGHLLQNDSISSLLSIALSPKVKSALQLVCDGREDFRMRNVLVIRMGSGSVNPKHQHENVFTANILLQDNPRLSNSKSGLFYTHYHAIKPESDTDDMVGPTEWRRTHNTQIGAMHARKNGVIHGVHAIEGEYQAQPDPDNCRYVMTYVLDIPRRNELVKESFPVSFRS